MWQLVINTAHRHLSIGLLKDGVYVDGVHEVAFKSQSEVILPRLKQCLSKYHLNPHDLSEVYVGLGPGSYTGVRIGLSVVKVLALVCSFEVFTFNSYDFMLAQHEGTMIMDARSSRAYVGIKQDHQWIFQGIMTLDELKSSMIPPYVGDTDLVNQQDSSLDFKALCEHVCLVSERVSDVHVLEPLYIKSL
jgi:tRNA threonylcarbamoyl adenosine modification protein YeaZ